MQQIPYTMGTNAGILDMYDLVFFLCSYYVKVTAAHDSPLSCYIVDTQLVKEELMKGKRIAEGEMG